MRASELAVKAREAETGACARCGHVLPVKAERRDAGSQLGGRPRNRSLPEILAGLWERLPAEDGARVQPDG